MGYGRFCLTATSFRNKHSRRDGKKAILRLVGDISRGATTHVAEIDAFGVDMVELDIRRRTRDRRLGSHYAKRRNRLIAELDEIGVTEAEFCRGLGRGQSLCRALQASAGSYHL